MSVLSASFVNTYPDVIRNMKISILNYVQALRTKKGHPDLPFGISNNQVCKKIVLDSTREGYSILPIPLPYENWNKMDWENLFTMYMEWHYSKFSQHICSRSRQKWPQEGNHHTYHIPKSNSGKSHSLRANTCQAI